MVKHIQTICQQQPTICLSVFDYFAGLALKGLNSWRVDILVTRLDFFSRSLYHFRDIVKSLEEGIMELVLINRSNKVLIRILFKSFLAPRKI